MSRRQPDRDWKTFCLEPHIAIQGVGLDAAKPGGSAGLEQLFGGKCSRGHGAGLLDWSATELRQPPVERPCSAPSAWEDIGKEPPHPERAGGRRKVQQV